MQAAEVDDGGILGRLQAAAMIQIKSFARESIVWMHRKCMQKNAVSKPQNMELSFPIPWHWRAGGLLAAGRALLARDLCLCLPAARADQSRSRPSATINTMWTDS